MSHTSLKNLILSETPQWLIVEGVSGQVLDIAIEIKGGTSLQPNRALLQLDSGDDSREFRGFVRSKNNQVGLFRYLSTGPGIQSTVFQVEVPDGCQKLKLGVRTWYANDSVHLLKADVSTKSSEIMSIVSVDVEALPGRAIDQSLAVDHLIFGDFGTGERNGIERICDIFADFGAKATFFVDYATCVLHGKEGIFKAADILKTRGHDVQLHMHPEVLVRHKKWRHDPKMLPAFDVLDFQISYDALEYGVNLFKENLGYAPEIIRPGGMKYSRSMLEAARALGIDASSSVYAGFNKELCARVGNSGTFSWSNGVKEMTLDLALDPLIPWEKFDATVRGIKAMRSRKPTFTTLLHSTSLLHRERTNAAKFTHYEPRYEQTLREYLKILASHGGFTTYNELRLDKTASYETFSLDLI